MVSALTASLAFLAAASYFDVPVKPEEYGLHPAHGAVLNVTPAPFVWRPLSTNAVGSYRLIYWKQGGWKNAVTVSGLVHNVYCPAETMAPGKWNWRRKSTSPCWAWKWARAPGPAPWSWAE